jgi:hypothetical protein
MSAPRQPCGNYCSLGSCQSFLMFSVLSAILVCPVTLYTSEKALSGCSYLTGSHASKRQYQHLSYVINMLVPVRYSFDKPQHERRFMRQMLLHETRLSRVLLTLRTYGSHTPHHRAHLAERADVNFFCSALNAKSSQQKVRLINQSR